MRKKIETFKVEFLATLEDSDYKFVHDYDNLETCIEIICIRDLLSRKARFKFFKLIGIERILIQMNKEILYNYMILQNGSKFDLYELTMIKYNEFERKADEKGLWG